MTIKAILFDMDGVLIDAREWHYEALNRALAHFGHAISRESHLSTFDGLSTRQKLRLLTTGYGLPEGLHDFLNALKQSYTQAISHQRCKPVFNQQYALSRLRQEGYRLAVCSNSVRQTVELMMKLSALEGYLDLMVSNEDVSRSKPDPEIYLKAMANLDVAPESCLIVEDNDHGIKAALASGGHLMTVAAPDEVTYRALKARIAELDAA